MNRLSRIILVTNLGGLLVYQLASIWWPPLRDQVLTPGLAWMAAAVLMSLVIPWPVQRHDQK